MKFTPMSPAFWLLPFTLSSAFGQTESTTENTQLDQVVVTAQAEKKTGYVSPETTTGALKSDVPLLETAQSISVVTQDLIEDQGAKKLEDVLRNVAGVSTGGYYDGWDYYRIRGFDSSFETFWDGLHGDYGTNVELYGLERVEVIKGPASSLYGQAPLGGIVNIVSKRPQHEAGGEISATVGSWNHYEGKLDYNTPLTPGASDFAGAKVYGRIVALYREKDSFTDYIHNERIYVAPSLSFEWGDDTKLTLLGEYTKDTGTFGMPQPAKGTVLSNINGDISQDLYIGLKNGDNFDQDRLKIGYDFKHRFNDLVTLRQNFSFSHLTQDWTDILYNSWLDADERTLYLYPYDYDGKVDRVAVDTALDWTFETGKLKHSLTTGFDYYYTRDIGSNRQIDYSDFSSYYILDLFNPVYNFSAANYATDSGNSKTVSEQFGWYVQDHVKLTDQLTLTAGGRYDIAKNVTTGTDEEAFTPKVGVTYEFIKGVAAYANYGTSFAPQWYSTDADGNSLPPEKGENFETGIKAITPDGRFSGMASVFHLTRSDVATANLATADYYDAITSGEQRSQGFELEGAARPIEGLEITGAYTWIDAEVTEDNTIAVGTPLPGVPRNTLNAWVKYIIQDGPLKGFGAGLGGRYVSSQSGDTNHSFDLPSYGLLDAALYYETGKVRAQLNFNNILDKRYYVGSYNDLYVLPGNPFNVTASVTYKF
ncbi:MAG: TonB-dependent siderophore receptor [Luteolibacter sp.]